MLLAVDTTFKPGTRRRRPQRRPEPAWRDRLLEKLVPMVAAQRAIVATYDGWYEAIYFTEEDTDAARHLPRR